MLASTATVVINVRCRCAALLVCLPLACDHLSKGAVDIADVDSDEDVLALYSPSGFSTNSASRLVVHTGIFYIYTSHSRGSMPAVLAPSDSPSEEQFTLGNVATEIELEPRRANLLGAFDDDADRPADEAGQDEPADAADGAAA